MCMRLQTDKYRIIAICLFLLTAAGIKGQSIGASYPDQYPIIAVHGGEVNSQASKNTGKMGEVIVELHLVAQMATMMEKWNQEYNAYLKDSTGLASSIRLGTTLYEEGAILMQNIFLLEKAIRKHPEGLAASIPMNNLYMETGALAIRCFSTLKKVITKGGEDNMLNGAERTELLWKLAGEMHELNIKVKKTAISIAYYELTDVWHKATQGMYSKDHSQLARESLDRWKRAYQASDILR